MRGPWADPTAASGLWEQRLRQRRAVRGRGAGEVVAGDERNAQSIGDRLDGSAPGRLVGRRQPQRLDARVLRAQPGGVRLDTTPGGHDALGPLPLTEVRLGAGAVVGVDAAAAVGVRRLVRL